MYRSRLVLARPGLVNANLRLTRWWRQCHPSHSNFRTSRHKPERHLPTISRRSIFVESLPSYAVPPTIFTGLLITLWTYKCIMTVLFQDKIIYMPYMPPYARSEKIEHYAEACQPVQWEHKHISSTDGTKIAICTGSIDSQKPALRKHTESIKQVVVCYFHGNGSSLPPRLPLLSNVLKAIESENGASDSDVRHTIIGLSYRGYWTSAGRASQVGIERDAQGLLQWIDQTYTSSDKDVKLILWGQSIGAGIASTAAASYVTGSRAGEMPLVGLILETPFTSIKSMLIGLYPQKWLPYRYLWPFLWNHWDAEVALERISQAKSTPKLLLLPATRDEVVPAGEANRLEDVARNVGLDVTRKDIMGALHTEATIRREGQQAVAAFIRSSSSNVAADNVQVARD